MNYYLSYVNQFLERCTWQIVFSKNSHSSISSHMCSSRILPLLIRRWSVFSLSLEHESRLVTAITKSLAEVLYVCDFFRLVPKKYVAAAWFSPSSILSWDGRLPLEPSHYAVRKPSSHMKRSYVGVLVNSTS